VQRGRLTVVLALLAVALGMPAVASASPDLEIGIADDAVFLHHAAEAPRIVRNWRAMGIETARIHARWVVIAPRPHDRKPPKRFNATNPSDRRYNWSHLDLAVDLLTRNGIKPIVTITGSGPLWSSLAPNRRNHRWKPDPAQFGAFATAVARRYLGRVHRYIIWNEPNQAGWLQPQFTCKGGRCTPFAPHHYRRLYRAARRAIKATDPSAEILIGALAPKGSNPRRPNAAMRPLTFLRALGCVSERYTSIATAGCRREGPLRTEGIAYHPHGRQQAPDQPNPNPDEASIADLPRLLKVIDRTAAHGILRSASKRHRIDLYLTEFGYQTNPPDKAIGVSPALQARWLAQSAYLAWKNPRVRNLSHYEWRDEKVSRKAKTGTRAYASWQSGLFYADGRAKPAYFVFPHPIWAIPRSDGLVKLWGQVRPGEGASDIKVMRRARGGSGAWGSVARVRTDPHGFWTATVRAPATAADYRFTYVLQPGLPGIKRAVRRFSQALDAVRGLLGAAPRPRGHAQRRR
jgi:hypothetical protein